MILVDQNKLIEETIINKKMIRVRGLATNRLEIIKKSGISKNGNKKAIDMSTPTGNKYNCGTDSIKTLNSLNCNGINKQQIPIKIAIMPERIPTIYLTHLEVSA